MHEPFNLMGLTVLHSAYPPFIIRGDTVDGDENVLGEEVVPDDAARHLPLVVRHVHNLPRLQMHAGHAAKARPHHVLLREIKEAPGLLEAHGISVTQVLSL